MSREPVKLNIYDMQNDSLWETQYWMNDYISTMGIGVFHTGVEVYGCEYSYGGHPLDATGIFENNPRDDSELGENFRFRETVLLGHTDFTRADVETLVRALSADFPGNKYHLITRNCNHFSSQFSKTLCGADVPQWVNRLAAISNSIPLLDRLLPPEWLTPVALQESLDRRHSQQPASTGADDDTAAGRLNFPTSSNNANNSSSSFTNSSNSDTTQLTSCNDANNSPSLLQRMFTKASVALSSAGSGSTGGSPLTPRRQPPPATDPSLGGQLDRAEEALDALENAQLSGTNSRASTIAQCDEAELNSSCQTGVKRFIDQFR